MSDLNLSPQEQRIVEYHKNSMKTGRVGRDDQGRPMTVYSTGILIERGPHKGKFVAVPAWVPSINPERPLTEGEAFDHWESQINEGEWPFYESGPALNSRSQEIHTIMDNDLIHINEDESKILENAQDDPNFQGRQQQFENAQDDPNFQGRQELQPTQDDPNFQGRQELQPTQMPTIKGEEGYFKAYDHRQLMTHLPNSMAADGLSAGPLSVTGMHYVDAGGEITTGLRGEKTPAHLSKNQDTAESFLASEMARASIEQLRASLPREVQDKLEGNVFVERADDGLFSLMVGDDDTGYVELSYGADDYQDALSDVKRAFNYSAHSGDAKIDAGFMGRASSAYRYNGYSKSALTQIGKDRMDELQSDDNITPDKIADALFEVDAINDEISRLGSSSKATEISYSRRALNREAKQRAAKMMQ
tara:strand:- start:1415 stop:2671 length:1257 start_codon:yes stop_codon:yes gene_type:complete